MQIRKATSQDVTNLVDFNCAMALETESKKLIRDLVTHGVNRLLNKPEYGFYVITEIDHQAVGSLMITNEWSDWRNGNFWWIQSVYVKPEFRQRGVYRAMYKHVQTLAESDENVCGFRLYVEKENISAQKTYRSLGMEETHYMMFEALKPNIRFCE